MPRRNGGGRSWSLFCFPHLSGLRIHGEAVSVAMSHRVNARLVARAPNESILRGDRPIVAQPHDLAGVVVRILSATDLRRTWCTDRHVQHAVMIEGDSRRFGIDRARLEDVASVHERSAVPCRAHQRRGTASVDSPFVVRRIDPMVLFELWVQDDVHQTLKPARSTGVHFGDAAFRFPAGPSVASV